MIKTLIVAVATLAASMAFAFAPVDINKADAAALDAIKGIGPEMSKLILEERAKGEFKDWADFQSRVKGVAGKRAMKLSEAGLQVGGKSMDAAAARPAKTGAKTAAKTAADAKPAPANM
jgi:competence protein ComEA